MKRNPKLQAAKKAITIIGEAVEIRKEISLLYKKYREFSSLACQSAVLNHHDLKRAVDALHYFGGGWPSENSRGRMEALLENFVGMYRILKFIGHGDMVEEHLKKFGVTVKLNKEFEIEDDELTVNDRTYIQNNFKTLGDPKTISDLVQSVVYECDSLQGEICKLADIVRDDLRPKAKEELDIEDQEYDRLFNLARTASKGTPKSEDKVSQKKSKINESVSHFNLGMSVIK